MREWEGVIVETVCLEETFSYPDTVEPELDKSIREVVETLGVQAVAAGRMCDATLSIALQGTPLSKIYSGFVVDLHCVLQWRFL